MHEEKAIVRAVAVAGSQSSLARTLQCSPQNVQRMCATGHVPAKHVIKIEAVTGISRHDLRPDLYPECLPTLTTNLRHSGELGQSCDHAGTLYSSEAR